MIDPNQIQAAAGAFSAVRELLTVGFNAKVDAAAQARTLEALQRLGEAQDVMYSLRDELFSLQDELRQLKQVQAEADRFAARRERYRLVKTQGGAVVLEAKDDPVHYACPSCENKSRIEILQPTGPRPGKYQCMAADCRAQFAIATPPSPGPVQALPTRTPWG